MIHICFNFSIIAQPRCELGKLLHFDLVLFNKTRNTLSCPFFISWFSYCNINYPHRLDSHQSKSLKKIGRVTAIRANSWSRFPQEGLGSILIASIIKYTEDHWVNFWYSVTWSMQQKFSIVCIV